MSRAIFFVVFYFPLVLFAEINPTFSYEKTTSCVAADGGVIIKFKDESTSSSTIVERIWNRGDGSPNITGNNPTPSWSYGQPGVYRVNLTIKNSSNEVEAVSQIIVVYPFPEVKFTVDQNEGCVPLKVNLVDQTVAATVKDPANATVFVDPIVSRSWDFGDGTLKQVETVGAEHTYTIPGNKRVRLTLTTKEGCKITGESVGDFIRVLDKPQADFFVPPASTCQFPVTVQATNRSTENTTFSWSVSGPATVGVSDPVAASPSFTFTQPGSYKINLLVKGTNGCSDQRTTDYVLSSAAISNQFSGPDSACAQLSVKFTNKTNPDPGVHAWYINGEKKSSTKDLSHIFSAPGTYLVRLESFFGNCLVRSEKQIRIDPLPEVDFVADQTLSCEFPFKVSFTDLTPGAKSRRTWAFGDGIGRPEQTPFGTQTVYTYNRAGVFSVGMTVVSDKGCASTKTRSGYVSIEPPVVLRTNLPDSGCAPFTLKPDVRFNIDPIIQSWDWRVIKEDGVVVSTSTAQTPLPIDLAAGKYKVNLRIRASSGCDKSYVWDVKVGEKPAPFDFNVNQAEACASEVFQFAYSGPSVSGYKWKFGGNDSVASPNPSRRFRNLGTMDVSLTVYNNGCENKLVKGAMVNVKGVVGWIDVTKDCISPLDKTLLDRSLGNIQQWELDYGDGNKDAYTTIRPQINHRYAQSGTYKVLLKVSGDGCSYLDSVSFRVTNEKGVDFVPSRLPVCIADTFLTLKAQVDNPAFIKSYEWDYGCGFTSATSSAEQKLNINSLCKFADNKRRGIYPMQLRVVDINNCIFTSPVKEIVVGGPVAAVAAISAVSGCSNLPVQFQDNTSADGINGIVSRIWDFGDGSSPLNIPTGPVSHLFEKAGDFLVSVTVTDQAGCTSKSNQISIKTVEPGVDFNALQKTSCLGKQIQFETITGAVIASYSWDLGEGNSSSLSSPVAVYNTVGKKDVRLTVRDAFGCESTKIKPQYIEIGIPVATFDVETDPGFCPPFNAKFSFSGSFADRFEWNFGDGGTAASPQAIHTYTKPGEYEVTLKSIGPGGCESISSPYKISVLGPTGSASYSDFSCKPFNTEFTLNSSTAQFVLIDYGDGNVSDAMPFQPTITYRYSDTGRYEPKIFFSNGSGCTIKIPTGKSIRMIDMQPVFRSTEAVFCGSGTVNFTDLSLSNDNLSGWFWDFGDGNSGTGKNTAHLYEKPGIYDVKLSILSSLGCRDTLLKKQLVDVRPNPEMEVLSSKSLICEDDFVQFEAVPSAGTNSLVVEWFWDFTNGLASRLPKPALQQFRKVGVYPMRLYVRDDKGCTDTVFYDFEVFPKPVVDAGSDVQLCLGKAVQLKGSADAAFEWLPGPSISCTSCAMPFVNPSNDASYYIKGTTTKGCVAIDSVRVNVVQPTKVVAAFDSLALCLGQGIKLTASGTALYSWSPSTALSAADVPDPLAKPTQSTTYVVEGRDRYNCFVTYDTVFLRVNTLPTVDAGRDTTLMAGYPSQLRPLYSPDVVSVKWEPKTFLDCHTCKTPVVTPSYSATYTVFVYNEAGCVAKDVVNVLATCTRENLFIPNTFSPNGDGMNDVFYPRGRGIEKIKTFRIFNRWGQLLYLKENFFANDQSAGWKGKYANADASADVYVFMVDVVCENGNIITIKGDVTLIR